MKKLSNTEAEMKKSVAYKKGVYFLLTNGKEEQMNFVSELFIRASCSRFRTFVHCVVEDVKLDAHRKTVCAYDM